MPINEPVTGSVHWSRVPVDHIERVEVVKADLRVGRRGDVFVKIQNLFDEAFEVTRNSAGLVGLGAPRVITAGLRVTL